MAKKRTIPQQRNVPDTFSTDRDAQRGLFEKSPSRIRDDVPIQDQRELCYDSLGICGKPECSQGLNIRTAKTGALTTIGEMAHIIAAQDNGPRGDPTFPSDKRERYENLILLCQPHHSEVDNPANFDEYTAATLRQWKEALRAQRRSTLARSREQPEIAVLGDLLNGLATAQPLFSDSFERIDLRKKIAVNDLNPNVEATISRNIVHVPMVSKQIALVERIRLNYGEMIETRMAAEWLTLSDRGIGGNEAYNELKDMLMFNLGRSGSEGVVDIVLAYFFERCTILHRQ